MSLLALLPYRAFVLETRLPPEEVSARLSAAVEPIRWFRWRWGKRQPFQGAVEVGGFRILRVIGYSNSFIPVIRGHVTPTVDGARIDGTMTLHPAVAMFTAIWLGGAFLFRIPVAGAVVAGGVLNPMMFMPVGMCLFGWGLAVGGFTFEARLSLRKLQEIVAAEPDTPTAAPERRQ